MPYSSFDDRARTTGEFRTVFLVTEAERGVLWRRVFRLRHNRYGSRSNHFNERIGILVLIEGVVATIRSCFSVLVFALLLCSVFPLAQIRWSFDIMCGSTGDIGSEQACDFIDTGAATDSQDDSPQETPGDCVASRVTVWDCVSSRSHASMNEIPPSTLLVFRLLHPPTAHS